MGWFFIIAVLLSLVIALYLGVRVMSLFNLNRQGYCNSIAKKIFWMLLIISTLSFIMSRALGAISDYWLPLLGNILFSLVLCFFYSILIIDGVRLIARFLLKKQLINGYLLQYSFLIIAAGLFIVGLYMASSPRVITYQLDIDKSAAVSQLKIVQLSDIHINETTSPHYIQQMVNDVNSLKPDYIFITGDTLDLRLKPYLDNNLAELFAQLESTYGTFIIFGNHEHYGIEREENNSRQAVIDAFEAGNMHVLLDGVFYDPKTGITIVGRDDYVVYNLGKTRLELADLLSNVEQDKPIILLDHQPRNLDDMGKLGIDVMYSGHTHAGQIFPLNLLVDTMYQNAWGVYQPALADNHFTSIVSSGYGLWGPPIRLMTRAEIVVTELNFNQNNFIN